MMIMLVVKNAANNVLFNSLVNKRKNSSILLLVNLFSNLTLLQQLFVKMVLVFLSTISLEKKRRIFFANSNNKNVSISFLVLLVTKVVEIKKWVKMKWQKC